MANNYYEQQRLNRIQSIQKWINEESPIQYEKARAEICLLYGVSRDTAREYLEMLETAEKIEVGEDEEITYTAEEA